MSTGLATTFKTLVASRNVAVGPVLTTALESADPTVYDGTLKAMISRRNKGGHLAILQRWHLLTPQQQEYLQEGRGRMSGALRNAVLSEEEQLFANACELVEKFQEFDLVSTLVTLAENQKSKHAEAATDLVLHLAQQLSETAHAPSDTDDPDDRRSPERLCGFVLESLERSVERYRTHKRDELIEAFVVLGGTTSPVLREILDDPYHPCYRTVINTLTKSQSAGVIEMLVSFLGSEHASLNILNVLSKRNDPEFVARLLKFASEGFTADAARNLARIRGFSWLQPGDRGIDSFSDQDQALCIKLVAATGIKPDDFLSLLENVIKHSGPEARWAACSALASIPGDRGNSLALKAIEDPDPRVQATATSQIRDRHVPNAMAILLKQIDSPHEEVRQVTCEALSEFSFENFLIGFEGLQEEARRTTGALVKKVDSKALEGILSEMEDPSRKRRLRALEIAEVMEYVPRVSEGILHLLEDEDHLVRAAAADTLQFCPTREVQEALRKAAHDRSGSVQSAAKSSLEVFDSLAIANPAGVSAVSENHE